MTIRNLFYLLIVTLSFTHCKSGNPEAEKIGLNLSSVWIELIDNEMYSESYFETSELLKKKVTEQSWVEQLTETRKPLGAVNTREVASVKYLNKLVGLPDGEFVIVIYTSTFANGQSRLESITSVHDTDSKWRIVKYFIK